MSQTSRPWVVCDTCLCGHLAKDHWTYHPPEALIDEIGTGIVTCCAHAACGCTRLRFQENEPVSKVNLEFYSEQWRHVHQQ